MTTGKKIRNECRTIEKTFKSALRDILERWFCFSTGMGFACANQAQICIGHGGSQYPAQCMDRANHYYVALNSFDVGHAHLPVTKFRSRKKMHLFRDFGNHKLPTRNMQSNALIRLFAM